ncbi:MAG: Crp/Fnr family transcriptional regulator [Saprospiraceae bacterium]
MIHSDLLLDYGAIRKKFAKHQVIFQEGQPAFYFFQIEEGMVKMVNFGDTRDYVQGIFIAGESFGEPPLFWDMPYPAAAIAVTDVSLLALPQKHFMSLLRNHFDAHLELTRVMCHRLAYKSLLLQKINLEDPEGRLLAVIDLLKQKLPREKYEQNGYFTLPLTRQDLADLTGLRVETVIRKIGQLEEKGEITIHERKFAGATSLRVRHIVQSYTQYLLF